MSFQKWAIAFSNFKTSLKEWFSVRKIRNERFINKFRHRYSLYWKGYAIRVDLSGKAKGLAVQVANIAATGALIFYALNHDNFIAYGLIAFLARTYFKQIIDELIRLKQVKLADGSGKRL